MLICPPNMDAKQERHKSLQEKCITKHNNYGMN